MSCGGLAIAIPILMALGLAAVGFSICHVPGSYRYTDRALASMPEWRLRYPGANLSADRPVPAGSSCNVIEHAGVDPGYSTRDWGSNASGTAVVEWYQQALQSRGWQVTDLNRGMALNYGPFGGPPAFTAYRGHVVMSVGAVTQERYLQYAHPDATPHSGDVILGYATIFETQVYWNLDGKEVMLGGGPAPPGNP